MRVAFVVVDDRFHRPEAAPRFGTAPTALLEGFESLSGEVEVHVVCCTPGELPRPQKLGKHIWFHSAAVPKIGFIHSLHWGCCRAVRRMIDAIKPDIVHAQGSERWCAIAASNLPYPRVLTIHGFLRMIDPLMRMRPRPYWKTQAILERLAIPRFDGVIAITHHAAAHLSDIARKTWVVPNATDSRYFTVRRHSATPPIVLYVGNIQELKNQVGFIDAIAPLAETCPFRLRICGRVDSDDAYAQTLLDRAKRHAWVEIVGHVDREKLKAELGAASILALASHIENCPMVILEAMSVGLPVVAAEVGGVPDLVEDGVNGYLCSPGIPESMRNSLRRLLEDPARATEMGAAGRDRALEHHLPTVVARQHVEIYREVLATRTK
jgi:glycosyltransferase involved in cell wall biosynthesis